jgi:hypothetical protein
MLQTLSFDVADVEYRCCRHVILGVVSRRKREGALDDVANINFRCCGREFRCRRHVMLGVVSSGRRKCYP